MQARRGDGGKAGLEVAGGEASPGLLLWQFAEGGSGGRFAIHTRATPRDEPEVSVAR
jgi:hypothetical protein